jgi:TAP-like protein
VVVKTLLALRERLGTHPLADGDRDASWANNVMQAPSAGWAKAAGQLAAARDGAPADAAPATGQPKAGNGFGVGYQDGEMSFVLGAVSCNGSPGARDFDTAWNHGEHLAATYPVAGFDNPNDARCSGWPFPAQPWSLGKGTSALQLVGHAFETNTVLPWAKAMRTAIGGTLLTVQDDVHSSFRDIPCAAKGVEFFTNGTPATGSCPGVPIPQPGH